MQWNDRNGARPDRSKTPYKTIRAHSNSEMLKPQSINENKEKRIVTIIDFSLGSGGRVNFFFVLLPPNTDVLVINYSMILISDEVYF